LIDSFIHSFIHLLINSATGIPRNSTT